VAVDSPQDRALGSRRPVRRARWNAPDFGGRLRPRRAEKEWRQDPRKGVKRRPKYPLSGGVPRSGAAGWAGGGPPGASRGKKPEQVRAAVRRKVVPFKISKLVRECPGIGREAKGQPRTDWRQPLAYRAGSSEPSSREMQRVPALSPTTVLSLCTLEDHPFRAYLLESAESTFQRKRIEPARAELIPLACTKSLDFKPTHPP
jgi:hypothetical protein